MNWTKQAEQQRAKEAREAELEEARKRAEERRKAAEAKAAQDELERKKREEERLKVEMKFQLVSMGIDE